MSKDWPQQVPQPHIYGNFRERFPDKHKSTFRQEREGMSASHLDLIRAMPCAVCLKMPGSDPHHMKSGPAAKERGVYLKATDKWAIPLCRPCHEDIERVGSRKEAQHCFDRGFDGHELAADLWLNTGDLEKMCRVLVAHREHFARHD